MVSEMNKQAELLTWATNTFGPIATNKEERIKRFAEEAIELCQACGLDYEQLVEIAMYVYDRDCGAIHQEIGQSALSLALLAEVCGEDMEKELNNEFDRAQSFDREYWQARQNRKASMGIGGFCYE